MIRLSTVRGWAAAALLMPLTARAGAAAAPEPGPPASATASKPERDHQDWAQEMFGEAP